MCGGQDAGGVGDEGAPSEATSGGGAIGHEKDGSSAVMADVGDGGQRRVEGFTWGVKDAEVPAITVVVEGEDIIWDWG